MINGASGLVSSFDPALALRINPLRSDDRISVATEEIRDSDVSDLVDKGLSLSPIDARFYSLKGITAEKEGDRKAASDFYRYSLDLLPTERQALSRQFVFDIEQERYASATKKLEVLGRRWPDRWSDLEPALPILLSHPVSYDLIMRRFIAYPPLATLLLRSLTKGAQTLPFAYRLTIDWHDRGIADLNGVINLVTSSFLREYKYTDAYLLFQLTRPENSRSGYVYNDAFAMPFSGNAFDWTVRNQAGVSFNQVSDNGKGASALSMRFLDSPIQFRNVTQLVRLVPGPYEATISYEGRDLIMPKPIRFAIRCLPSTTMSMSVPLQEGTYERSESHAFRVPVENCALQELYLYNDKLPQSWRNRYRGTLELKSIKIRRRSGA